MFINPSSLQGYKLNCLDGEIGSVKDFYFDDLHWAIRHLVAESGTWLSGRQVLISPHALKAISVEDKNIVVNLTKKQIEDSPSLLTDQPVSHQFEKDAFSYYGWPVYWTGPYMWGETPNLIHEPQAPQVQRNPGGKEWDPNLRSTQDVIGHRVHATDGEIGHIDDFIINDQDWAVRYLVIDTRNWWPGRKVLIAPQWIKRISWPESKVFVYLTTDMIKHSPTYTEDALLTRDYETALYSHYNRHGYWTEDQRAKSLV
jgi:uncharacterized protein YrrD